MSTWTPIEVTKIVVPALLTVLNGYFTWRIWTYGYREQRLATFLKLEEIIRRHHSEEITRLRRTVMTELERKGKMAKGRAESLKDFDQEFQIKASSLANYYEGLGMFLRGVWPILDAPAKQAMLEMLHNSVSTTWPLINRFRDQIRPGAPPDWAGSYQWLYVQVMQHRRKSRISVSKEVTAQSVLELTGR